MRRARASRVAVTAAWMLAFGAVAAACGEATWGEALRAAEAGEGSPLAHAELTFVVGHDARAALSEAEAILGRVDAASPEAGRALMLALEASRASGELERPLPWLAAVLSATRDPVLAERLADECERYAGRLDGGSISAASDALARVLAQPGAAWEPARVEAWRQLRALRRLTDPGASISDTVAYVNQWRLSAPWGTAAELDFDRALGPETRALAEREDTHASFDARPVATTTQRFSDGEVAFFDLQGGGTGFAEATIGAPFAGQRVVVRLETNRRARLFVDGREALARVDPDAPWMIVAPVDVPAAGARLTVKLSTPDGTGFVRVMLSVLGPGSMPAPAKIKVAVGDGGSAVQALADLDRHLSRPLLDVTGARLRMASLEQKLGPSPVLDLLAARLARIDARTPVPLQRKEARARLERVRAAWPANPVATRALARLEKEEDQPDRALVLLNELGASGGKPDARTLLEKLELVTARGWEADALEAVQALRAKPGLVDASPRVAQAIIDSQRSFGRMAAAREDAARASAHFAAAMLTRLADLEVDAGALAAAADHYAQAFRAEPERHALLRSAVAAWRAEGSKASLAAASQALASFMADRPDDAWAWAETGRLALQQGDRQAATRALDRALELHPDFAPIEALIAELAGRAQAFDDVADGRALLAAYRADAAVASWGAYPVVSVLERTLVDVRADGSTLELQHKIRLVQSRAGADALGDFTPPDGARLLVARTLKADGRVLYPERTEGKTDLSFPELQIGDAVETAFVARSRVAPSEGGYLTGVSFAGWSAPTYRQDAQFHVAKGLALVATRFGGAPEPAVTTLPDGSRTWLWSGATLPAVPREPQSISARSFFPFADLRVVVGDGNTSGAAGREETERAWIAIAESFAARLERMLAPGPRTTALAKRLATLDAAFTWVKTDMEDVEQLNLFETPAEAAIGLEKGNRALALLAIARAQGRIVSLWLCAPQRDGVPEDRELPTPNSNRFFYPLVAAFARDAGSDARPQLLDPSRPWMPFDAIPAELRGSRCLVPERAAHGFAELDSISPFESLWVDVPAADPKAPPSFEVDAEITVSDSGEASATVHGLARGVPSVVLRQLWQGLEIERRRALWEQWAGTLVLGARLKTFEVMDAEEPERPMRWTLELDLPGWATVVNGRVVIGKPFATLAASDLASVPALSGMAALPARVTPLRVSPHSEKVTIRIDLPAGTTITEKPPELSASTGPAALTQHVTVTASRVVIERSARFEPARVNPSDYAPFRAFVDQAERALNAPVHADLRAP